MPDDDKNKLPPIELDTKELPPEDGGSWKKFLLSSPSFRQMAYGTLGAAFVAATATIWFIVDGPDQTHNPIVNGVVEKLYPELKR